MNQSLYSSMTLPELFIEKRKAKEEETVLKEKNLLINNEFESRFSERAKNKLIQEGKDFGCTSVHDGAHKVKINFRKRVDWDQDKLIKVLNNMDLDTAKHYVDVNYKVSESKYNNAPPNIKVLLEDCRTVFPQGISFDIEEVE